MVSTIQFYRGLKAGLPTLKAGEPGWCTDTLEFYIGNGTTNQLIGGEITALTPTQIRTLLNVGEIVDKEQIYFVGKHGNDGNDGKTNDKAFLTFGAAITAAIAETPAADNKFNIICFDAGIYAENVTVPSYVYVYAPKAELNGTHTIADNTCLHVYSIEIAAGTAVSKTVGTGSAYFNFHGLKLTGSASGFLCTAGEIEIDGSKISVENGYGVGSAITGHMHVGVNTIHVTGIGICAGIASTGELSITADCLYDEGVGGTGLYVGSTGTLNAQIANLDCATAYNIATAGATLNLMVASLAGTETNSGTANVSKAEDGHTSGADTTLGAQSGDLDMNSHQVVSLSVPDAAGEAIRQTAKITEAALETLVDGGGGGGGGDTLPIVDTTAVVKGSVDATKLVRIEADGLTTGTTRVLTMPDKDITPAESGANSDITSMTGITGVVGTPTNLVSKTTATLSKSIGSGGDYATFAAAIAACPNMIAHAVIYTIETGTTLTETCTVANKHGITTAGSMKIVAEKYFPTSGQIPTADSASGTTLVDAALATAALGDDYFNDCWVFIVDGTGTDNGFVPITDYIDVSGTVTVASWPGTQPDNTSRYIIVGALIDGGSSRNYGMHLKYSTLPLTVTGIGIKDCVLYGAYLENDLVSTIFRCGVYNTTKSGIYVKGLSTVNLSYNGIVNCNTSNGGAEAGVRLISVQFGYIIYNGLSDNGTYGFFGHNGGYIGPSNCFGDLNGTWGTYVTSGVIANCYGVECSGTSGDHSNGSGDGSFVY